MRVLLATYRSRGDVEPMVGLAVRLRALGAEVRVCAPPVPVGRPARPMVHGAAEESDASVATGVGPAGAWR